MKDIRLFLYVALGMLLFGLWNAWQKDYAPQPQATANTAITAANTNNTQSKSEPTSSIITKTPTSRIITVHTDVLDVGIDTLGGNVVSAKLLKYPAEMHKSQPVELFNNDPETFYVAASNVQSQQNTAEKPQLYVAEKREYQLADGAAQIEVKLQTQDKGAAITKTFIFERGKYNFKVNFDINNRTSKLWNGKLYAELTRKPPEVKSGMFGFNTYNGAAISSADKPYEKISFGKMEKENLTRSIQGGWLAMQQRYFISSWIPNQDKTYHYFSKANDKVYTIGLVDNSLQIPAGEKASANLTLYVGPELVNNLKPLAKGLDLTIDYGWLWPISVTLMWLMKYIYKVIGNWGWAIIILTILIKAVFYKLSETSCCSMAKMKELSPKIAALKERYGDDRQKLSQSTMELYRKEKINPLGGCLPMLVQIPFFIALYYVLIGAVELRQAPFILWITDLSVRDPYFVLPILNGLTMFLQQKLTPSSPDPAQQKMMMLMPIIFTVFFISFPAGLVLYWLVNSGLSVLQQWYITNKLMCKTQKKHFKK